MRGVRGVRGGEGGPGGVRGGESKWMVEVRRGQDVVEWEWIGW